MRARVPAVEYSFLGIRVDEDDPNRRLISEPAVSFQFYRDGTIAIGADADYTALVLNGPAQADLFELIAEHLRGSFSDIDRITATLARIQIAHPQAVRLTCYPDPRAPVEDEDEDDADNDALGDQPDLPRLRARDAGTGAEVEELEARDAGAPPAKPSAHRGHRQQP